MKNRVEAGPLINKKINAERMQVISETGENLGVLIRAAALALAQKAGLDLVLIAEEGKDGVPICKITDFGKDVYEKKKKLAESKKNQKVIKIKEIKIQPKIGENDYQIKIKQALGFLADGMRVKVTLWFRGRENVRKEVKGPQIFEKIEKSFEENGYPADELICEKDPKAAGQWTRIYYLKKAK